MPTVTVSAASGSERRIKASRGALLLDVLLDAGYKVPTSCGGNGRCGNCAVAVLKDGEMKNVLSCRERVFDDIEVIFSEKEAETYEKALAACGEVCAAVDIGTTTVAVRLSDPVTGEEVYRSLSENPQRRYGADVMTRIKYCTENADGTELLSKLIRLAVSDALSSAVKAVSAKNVIRAVICGNTAMISLLFCEDVSTLGRAPYKAPVISSKTVAAQSLGLSAIGKDTEVYVLPAVSAFVGGDITAGVYALYKTRKELKTPGYAAILTDLGTNAETVLLSGGNDPGALIAGACSCAAGPCFEGGNISCGMPSGLGAIYDARLEDGKIRFSVKGDAAPAGVCGTGLFSLVSLLIRTGAVDETGRMLTEGEALESCAAKDIARRVTGKGFYIADGVFLTQKDVREFMTAKAAVFAGISVLMKKRGAEPSSISDLFISGGFSESLKREAVRTVKLFPGGLCEKSTGCENTALLGAAILSVSDENERRICEKIASGACTVELAGDPDFSVAFLDALTF